MTRDEKASRVLETHGRLLQAHQSLLDLVIHLDLDGLDAGRVFMASEILSAVGRQMGELHDRLLACPVCEESPCACEPIEPIEPVEE